MSAEVGGDGEVAVEGGRSELVLHPGEIRRLCADQRQRALADGVSPCRKRSLVCGRWAAPCQQFVPAQEEEEALKQSKTAAIAEPTHSDRGSSAQRLGHRHSPASSPAGHHVACLCLNPWRRSWRESQLAAGAIGGEELGGSHRRGSRHWAAQRYLFKGVTGWRLPSAKGSGQQEASADRCSNGDGPIWDLFLCRCRSALVGGLEAPTAAEVLFWTACSRAFRGTGSICLDPGQQMALRQGTDPLKKHQWASSRELS